MHRLPPAPGEDRHRGFKAFVSEHVSPAASGWDKAQQIPASVVSAMAASGYLGCTIPAALGGSGWDTETFGLLNEALGFGTAALADLITVQAMVAMTLLKWGTEQQQARWLPLLATGEMVGAFALTEPGGGSDLRSLKTELKGTNGDDLFLLSGRKTWISFGQTAGLFLVFGMHENKSAACLVTRDTAGLEIRPIMDMMGFRSAGLAELVFDDVEIPATNLIGKPGVALSHIAPIGLLYGRIGTAHSALGLLRGCLEESVSYANSRTIGSGTAGDLGMVRSMIAAMGADYHASRLLCRDACIAADQRDPDAHVKSLLAKYFASTAAVRCASNAVQIMGAAGCHEQSRVARYYRDAKVLEIIEGTTQVHEDILGRSFMETAYRPRAS